MDHKLTKSDAREISRQLNRLMKNPPPENRRSVAKIKPPALCRRSSPYWDYTRDGCTVSSLQTKLACSEQFRLGYVEGWTSSQMSAPFEFGHLIHHLIARWLNPRIKDVAIEQQTALYERQWKADHKEDFAKLPRNLETMELFYVYAEALMPFYYEEYPDDPSYNWTELETPFKVEIKEAETILRGIKDGACFKPSELLRRKGRFVLENKGFSQIDDYTLETALPHSLQNMTYLVVDWLETGEFPDGVIFNVIRRPGSVPKKGEDLLEFKERLMKTIEKDRGHYFYRYEVVMTPKKILRWYKQTFLPIVWSLQDWANGGIHFMNPEALANKYGRCTLFDAICSGNYSFLQRKPFSSRYGER